MELSNAVHNQTGDSVLETLFESSLAGKRVLITGGAGFFGDFLKRQLIESNVSCVSIDLNPDPVQHEKLISVIADIRDPEKVKALFADHGFQAVFHCAAMLAHAVRDKNLLWTSNVDGTKVIADAAVNHDVPKLVFISSNCLWGTGMGRPITEEDAPSPAEIYGKSKLHAERILADYSNKTDVTIIRSPTIVDEGRLGLLAVLFEFIRDDNGVWVVGSGDNRYQFVYARDLADACMLAIEKPGSSTYNVGSDDVKSLREVFSYVIKRAGSKSKIRSLPRQPTLGLMRLANALRISPLGPYHVGMIDQDFAFDTSKAKATLGWRPTLNNEEMLYRAYEHYVRNLEEIKGRTNVAAHRQGAKMGIIRLLKWLS